MLNANGILSALDRGITINWDDGPTLHKITAQARYHTGESATAQLLRVGAAHQYSDDPLTFTHSDSLLQAVWVWQEHGEGWSAQLVISNPSDTDVYIDALETVRIDSAFGGVFSLGAPPGLWRCARENDAELVWEAWAETTASIGGFHRARSMLVQPTVSNRSRPPALLMAMNASTTQLPTDIRLECNGERFDRLTLRTRADGTLLGAGATLTSAEVWIASGDEPEELLQWASSITTSSPLLDTPGDPNGDEA